MKAFIRAVLTERDLAGVEHTADAGVPDKPTARLQIGELNGMSVRIPDTRWQWRDTGVVRYLIHR